MCLGQEAFGEFLAALRCQIDCVFDKVPPSRRSLCRARALSFALRRLLHARNSFGANSLPVIARQGGLLRLQSLSQQRRELLFGLALLIVADKFAHVLTRAAVTTGGDLSIDEVFQRFRQRNV